MRILIATSHRSLIGGVETYLQALLPMLRQRGLELGLLCTYPAAGQGAIDEHCPGLPVWMGGDLGAVQDWKPDVVYSHDLSDPAADAALASRFPTVYYAHGYSGTCVSGSKCHSFPGPRPCSHTFGPACLALYYPRRCGGLNPITALANYRANRGRRTALLKARAVLAASRHMVKELVRNDVPAERAILNPLFPCGTRPEPQSPAGRSPTGRLLFLGRITALKGWRQLLEAIPTAAATLGRRLALIVAGDGPDRQAFAEQARRRGVPAEFLGWIGPERREAEMRAADVLVVPSVWPEPFGLVGIEAGCVGLPAVGFAVGGIPDWLIPGVSGELAPGERPDPGELANAIGRALADESHWQRLRVGAWETAKQFTPERHLERLIDVLAAAVGG